MPSRRSRGAAAPRASAPRRRADPFVVRRASLADERAVFALWRETDALHARLRPDFFRAGSGREPARFPRLVAGAHELLLVAERAGAVIGLLHATLEDTPPTPEMAPRWRLHVADLVVTRDCRRLGIGRALVEHAEAWGRARGAEQLVLTVWSGNRTAERFYRALGLLPVARVLAREL